MPELAITRPVQLDPGERWALLSLGADFHILDLVHLTVETFQAVDGSVDDTGVVLLHADGSLWHWQPGASVRQIGVVPAPSPERSALDARGDRITVVYPDRIVRLTTTTQRMDTAAIPDTAHHGLMRDGTVWARQDHGTVWRWPVDGAPVRVEVPQPPRGMALSGDDVLFYTHEAVTLLRGTKRHTVSVASALFNWDGGDTITTVTAQGVPSILDMETELSFRLPITGVTQIAGHGHHLATGNSFETTLWNIDVPDDPRELQAWLQTVTNVKTIPGSEAYAWP